MKIFWRLYLWTMLFLMDNHVNGLNKDEPEPSTLHQENLSHRRQKRLIWITTDGRLAMPPGTSLVISPILSLPFIRYPPHGFQSNMTISLPFTIDFDTLGLTDNQNPFGGFPPLSNKKIGRSMGSIFTEYVDQVIRGRRSIKSVPPLSKPIHSYFQGGERALLYIIVEDMLTNFGMDGKACLLRTICEVHGHRAIHRFGFIGEFLQLFLSASKSNYANLMQEYVTAEKVGKHNEECYPYFKKCSKSLFTNNNNYSDNDMSPEDEESILTDFGFDDQNRDDVGNEADSHTKSAAPSSGPKVKVNPAPLAM